MSASRDTSGRVSLVYFKGVNGGPRFEPIRLACQLAKDPSIRLHETIAIHQFVDGRFRSELDAEPILDIFPQPGKPLSIPCMVMHEESTVVYECNAILSYVGARGGLIPDDLLQAAIVNQFLCQVEELQSRYQRSFKIRRGLFIIDPVQHELLLNNNMKIFFEYLENYLKGRGDPTYLVGEKATIADLKVYSYLQWIEGICLDPLIDRETKERAKIITTEKYPRISEWMVAVKRELFDTLEMFPAMGTVYSKNVKQNMVVVPSHLHSSHIEMQCLLYNYWFGQEEAERRLFWFRSGPEVDKEIREKFLDMYNLAKNGKLECWREEARGCVALILLLDQFPRNMFRGTKEMFATDSLALRVAKQCYLVGPVPRYWDRMGRFELLFILLVFEHQENLKYAQLAVEQLEEIKKSGKYPDGEEQFWTNAITMGVHHLKMLENFGRLPYRNAILGRTSTAAEIEFLDSGIPPFAQSVSKNVNN